MQTLTLTVAVTLLLGSAVLQIALALGGYRASRAAGANGLVPDAVRNNLQAMTADIGALHARLHQIEQQLASLEPRAPRAEPPVNQAYDVAVHLARKGVGVDELMSTCGLSRGEAELLERLYHGAGGAPAAAGAPR